MSGIYGDVSGIREDVSGIYGEVTGINGDIDTCELTDEVRRKGVNVNDLVS